MNSTNGYREAVSVCGKLYTKAPCYKSQVHYLKLENLNLQFKDLEAFGGWLMEKMTSMALFMLP